MNSGRFLSMLAHVSVVASLALGGCAPLTAKPFAARETTPAADAEDDLPPVLTSADPMMFPHSWRAAPISASGEALSAERLAHATAVLQSAMRKYPSRVLQSHLKGVYALAELRYSAIVAGGTNSRSHIYLKIGEVAQGFTDQNVEAIFHAEFSSILLRNRKDDFDAAAWLTLNPLEFEYLGNGVDAVKQHKVGLEMRDDLLEQGFLGLYGQSTMENDFNGFAARLFRGDPTLWDKAERFPKIRSKLDLTIRFYQKIDSTLSEAYFRSLRKQ